MEKDGSQERPKSYDFSLSEENFKIIHKNIRKEINGVIEVAEEIKKNDDGYPDHYTQADDEIKGAVLEVSRNLILKTGVRATEDGKPGVHETIDPRLTLLSLTLEVHEATALRKRYLRSLEPEDGDIDKYVAAKQKALENPEYMFYKYLEQRLRDFVDVFKSDFMDGKKVQDVRSMLRSMGQSTVGVETTGNSIFEHALTGDVSPDTALESFN